MTTSLGMQMTRWGRWGEGGREKVYFVPQAEGVLLLSQVFLILQNLIWAKTPLLQLWKEHFFFFKAKADFHEAAPNGHTQMSSPHPGLQHSQHPLQRNHSMVQQYHPVWEGIAVGGHHDCREEHQLWLPLPGPYIHRPLCTVHPKTQTPCSPSLIPVGRSKNSFGKLQ